MELIIISIINVNPLGSDEKHNCVKYHVRLFGRCGSENAFCSNTLMTCLKMQLYVQHASKWTYPYNVPEMHKNDYRKTSSICRIK